MLLAKLAAAALAAASAALSPPPQRPVFAPVSIAFWDARNGLVAGVERRSDGYVVRARVDVTHDGGRTWRIVGRAPGAMRVAAVRGANAGFLLSRGRLFATADRGRRWHVVSRTRLDAVSFATSRLGFALAGRRLLATRDGGRTWTRLRIPCSRWFELAAVVRASRRKAWLLCAGQGGGAWQAKEVLATTDGGRTWRVRAQTVLPPDARVGDLPALGHPRGIDFLADGHGWLWQGRGDFLATRDGGRHWRRLPISRPELVEGGSATLLSRRVGVALLFYQDLLALTPDGGRTWRPLHHWG